jgi:UDP-N-acetylglucosamine 2-epimerase (non-hydrolysing)
MQDLLDEFEITSPQIDAIPAGEHATVGSLIGWAPVAYRAIVRALRQLADQHGPLSVIVHGDTLSTVIGALAAKRTGHAVLHLESGLSSGRIWDPFPEELSRRIVFRLADIALCPNEPAAAHMRARYRCKVFETGGNTIIDAVRLASIKDTLDGSIEPYVVASLHRFQNLFNDARLQSLIELIEKIGGKYVVHFVLHPATRKRLQQKGFEKRLRDNERIRLLPRLGYRDFLTKAAHAECVLTDGGSNQEELAVLGVPTIIMRATTERPDGLNHNAVMESDIKVSIENFVIGEGFRRLRRPSQLSAELGPSNAVVDILLQPDRG